VYAADAGYFTINQPHPNALKALNGAWNYVGRMPTKTAGNWNYWIDVRFTPLAAAASQPMRAEIAGLREQLVTVTEDLAEITKLKG
jgi:hypothetical protein